ncbi:MAG: nucleotide exchange factor GrpE [Syntrophomonadaceae bacterium]
MDKNWETQQNAGSPVENEVVHNAADTGAEAAEPSLETKMSEELRKLQEEARKNYDNYLRALAEVENIKKRSQRDREEYVKYANMTLIKKLLPIIDDLNRAIEASGISRDFEALSKGVEMTARNLGDLLTGEGVKPIESLGKPFDPQYHQALSVEPNGEYPENTVIEQLQTGYIMHDRVIRPSLVKVSAQ